MHLFYIITALFATIVLPIIYMLASMVASIPSA